MKGALLEYGSNGRASGIAEMQLFVAGKLPCMPDFRLPKVGPLTCSLVQGLHVRQSR